MQVQSASRRMIQTPAGHSLSTLASGHRKGVPVVFSNSLAADLTMWDAVVERLSDDFSSLRYDARGHGESDVVTGSATIEDLGQDVLALMDAYQMDRAVFCGLSLGGLTGMWLAANAPDRIAALVLANTAANFPPPSMWEQRAVHARKKGVSDLVQATLQRWLTERFRTSNPAPTQAVARMIGSTSAEGYAVACEVLAATDLSSGLAQVKCPVLVISGDHDASTPPARAREIVKLTGNASLVELDAAHLSAVEAAPCFADTLNAFLSTAVREEFGSA